MKNIVIYQLSLRVFTPEGTISAAEKLLPHIRSLGVDYVYLCPMFVADDSEDRATWSPRQIAAGCGNPKNPYKMKDYFNVDPEYGTNEDMKRFIETAHDLGLRVLLDLVYLHCGAGAVFIAEHPDWVEQNEDGTTKVGAGWPFARINYGSEGAREYLWDNMMTLIRNFGADGFRCDVGDNVPLDFWKEGRRRCEAIREDILMLNEGTYPEYVKSGVFDLDYKTGERCGIPFERFWKEAPGKAFGDLIWLSSKAPGQHINIFECHDSASDCGTNRLEKILGYERTEQAYFLIYLSDGVPFIWNGNEIADTAEQCMFSNRFYGKRAGINWQNALTEEGKRRIELIRTLSELRHRLPMLVSAKTELLSALEDPLVVFTRKEGKTTVCCLINFGKGDRVYENEAIARATTLISARCRRERNRVTVSENGFIALSSLG